jgi:protein gp37
MAENTPIEWCDSTVNPTAGCDGCELWTPKLHGCYAGNIFPRLGYPTAFDEEVHLRPGKMADAASWSDRTGKPRPNKPWLTGLPRLIFISDMSDALSRSVPFEYLLSEIINVVVSLRGHRHRWIWLSKQPQRMAEFAGFLEKQGIRWPDNLWPGTSITTQSTASRIDHLLKVGDETTVRFVSVEPQLEPVDLGRWLPSLNWVIQGGESSHRGYKARPFDLTWASDLIDQCGAASVPLFLKQLGSSPCQNGKLVSFKHKKGGDWEEWPEPLRVRQMPSIVGGLPEQKLPRPTAIRSTPVVNTQDKHAIAEETLNTKLEKLADHTRRVAKGIQNGMFIYGRQGTSKTYTILKTLEAMGAKHSYNNGHVNPEPLFDMFCANPDGIIILDDVSHILSHPKILDFLLAALGTQADSGARRITNKSSQRKKRGEPEEVDFTGGVILVSNIPIGSHKLHQPLLSRVFPHEHDLSDDEMDILFYLVAASGYSLKRNKRLLALTPDECREAADFVLKECREIQLRPNVRHLVEIAYKCRLDRESEFHWKTHVEDALKEAKKLEAAIKAEVVETGSDVAELISIIYEADSKRDVRDKWMEATGSSRPTFFRKLKELPKPILELYEQLDTPEGRALRQAAQKERDLFRGWLEDVTEIRKDQRLPVSRTTVVQAWVELEGDDYTEDVFHARLREQPDLLEWFKALPE